MSQKESESAVERVAEWLERSNAKEYIDMTANPWRLIWNNFLGGVARGFGLVVGATLVVALALLVLDQFGTLPFIGSFLHSIGDSLKAK